MNKSDRRDFLKKAAIAAAAAGAGTLVGCGIEEKNKTAVKSSEKFEWKMVTTWPPHFPLLGEYADKLAEWINIMSEGRLKIQVYGGGELVPALEVFDAVSQGVAEMGHGAAYYWAGKVPGAQFFTSVPFGMNTQQVYAWLYGGGGIELWEELYADFNLFPFPAGNTGGQMGGWFNKEINSVSDLNGLKIRMPGLGGKAITKAGATSILSPGSELYTNLERGVIDALEWIGPYHDYLMGFHKIAKYCYYPGWQEPTAITELMINKSAYEKLPDDLKQMIRTACNTVTIMMLSEFHAKNTEYYYKMKDEGIQFRKFPDDVLNKLRSATVEVLQELRDTDEMSKKIYDSYHKFHKDIANWFTITEENFIPEG